MRGGMRLDAPHGGRARRGAASGNQGQATGENVFCRSMQKTPCGRGRDLPGLIAIRCETQLEAIGFRPALRPPDSHAAGGFVDQAPVHGLGQARFRFGRRRWIFDPKETALWIRQMLCSKRAAPPCCRGRPRLDRRRPRVRRRRHPGRIRQAQGPRRKIRASGNQPCRTPYQPAPERAIADRKTPAASAAPPPRLAPLGWPG